MQKECVISTQDKRREVPQHHPSKASDQFSVAVIGAQSEDIIILRAAAKNKGSSEVYLLSKTK